VEPEQNLDGEFVYSCQLPEIENGKAAWVPGDQILIHGEYSADQKIVTLTPADISEDGKTLTFADEIIYSTSSPYIVCYGQEYAPIYSETE
jgi:hypothetical protein